MTRRFLLLVVTATLVGSHLTGSAQSTFSMRVAASDLGSPWEITIGPDQQLWVSERTARRIVRVDPVIGTITPAVTIDESYDPGRAWHEGVMGLALHPELLRGTGHDHVFVAYTYDADSGPELVRRFKVRRYTYDPRTQKLIAPVDIIANIPAHVDHAGGRLVIGPDLKLYLSRGDGGANFINNPCLPNHAQDLPTAAQVAAADWSAYDGKILRLNLDGSVPSDNPVINGVRSHVYSYGHRNPQGLQFGPTGLLYESEHGPSTDDEINLITAGGNYGWPYVAGYRDDRNYVFADWAHSANPPCASLKFDEFNTPSSVPTQKETDWQGTFTPPLRTFFTPPEGYSVEKSGSATIAPGGLEVYSARPGIAGWTTSILQASMTMGRVYRVKLSEDGRTAIGESEELFRTANRYRDVAVTADGLTVYLATDTNGFGSGVDLTGARITTFANPGAILEFRYIARNSID